MAAAFVFGVTFIAMGQRSVQDLTLVFVDAPRHIVPEGHVTQVEVFKKRIPKGATVFYFMDTSEGWQVGLWQRSLYPDYVVLPVTVTAESRRDEARVLRERNQIDYALSAGRPPLDVGFDWQVLLPGYPNGIPIILGKLQPW
jgi:hypothetical protein